MIGLAPGVIAAAGSSAEFSPLDIPDTLYFLTAESRTTSGTDATAVIDLGPEGNNSTSGTEMAILSAYRNGRDALQSAPSKYLKRVTFAGGSQAQPWEVFIVAETPSSWPSGAQYVWGSGTGTTSRCEIAVTNVPQIALVTNSTVAGSGINPPTSNATIFCMKFNGSSSQLLVEWHGGSTRRSYDATTLLTTAIDGYTVGDTVSPGFPWRGPWFTTHAKKGIYTTDEREALFAWAKAEYAIAL